MRQASFTVQTVQSKTKMNIQINTIIYRKNTVGEIIRESTCIY